MKIAVPKEIAAGEYRVSAIPETVAKMVKEGIEVVVESGAGEGAYFSDAAYEQAGAKIVTDSEALFQSADIILKIQRPMMRPSGIHEVEMMKSGAVLVGLIQPLVYPDLVGKLAARGVTSFAVDLVPRITRAQRVDILSSMSSLAGYKAVLLAAAAHSRLVPMMTTSAGTYPPAKVLILGAGVAGLQAIATAKRMGAVVAAFDTRPAVKEEVQSLGATFIEMDTSGEQTHDTGGYATQMSKDFYKREVEVIAQQARQSDIVITTALIPGKEAPLLIPKQVVYEMKKGSVIVDMAVEQGGNCELSRMGETVVEQGVIIIGATHLPATIPMHASQMYSKNVWNFVSLIHKAGTLQFDINDEIIKATLLTHQGAIVNTTVQSAITKGEK